LIMGNRKIKAVKTVAVIIIYFSFCMPYSFAQSPNIKTEVDKAGILIGEQIKYKVSASFPAGVFKVNWFTIPDSVAHFEIVDRSKIDTSTSNSNTLLEQTITLTSFDSGRWNTPALRINFDPVKDDTTINIFTDSIPVNVGYAKTDSTNELRDIKPIMEVTVKSYLWYYIAGATIVLLAIAFMLWRYFKNRKKEPALISSSKLTPYDEAMQNLEKLKQLNLQNPEDIKQYHAKLSAIFKWFISRKQRVSIMNKTTGDVLVHLTQNNLPKDIVTQTATALRCGDAVKFAKYLPVAGESEACFNGIKETINFIHTSKPVNQLTN
jgi:hypothetical protein